MYLIGICEDNYEYRKWAKRLIEQYCQQEGLRFVIYEFSKENEILDFYEKKAYNLDFLFLNTILDGKISIDLAKNIKERDKICQLIFWSENLMNYSKVYEVEHSYHVNMKQLEGNLNHIFAILLEKHQEILEKKLVLALKGQRLVLNQMEIQYMERFKRNTLIYLHDTDEVITTSKKLDFLYYDISHNYFLRCHNSYIVNLNYVTKFYRTKFILSDGAAIPISRKYYEETKMVFQQWEKYING